jgi:hypothetical protein
MSFVPHPDSCTATNNVHGCNDLLDHLVGAGEERGRHGDPRARRGDRGSGLARAWKESQAVIVGGVSLEAAPTARQDDAETASIIVNGRKGLNEHGHRGGPAVLVSSARSHRSRSLPLLGQAPQHGASDSYSAARFRLEPRGAFSNALNFCRSAIAALVAERVQPSLM